MFNGALLCKKNQTKLRIKYGLEFFVNTKPDTRAYGKY